MQSRLEPGWSFAALYLLKDSLALMMEGACHTVSHCIFCTAR